MGKKQEVMTGAISGQHIPEVYNTMVKLIDKHGLFNVMDQLAEVVRDSSNENPDNKALDDACNVICRAADDIIELM